MRSMTEFFSNIELGVDTFKTINGNEFTVTSVDDKHINISIPGNATVNKLTLSLDEVRKMLESGQKFDKIKDVTTFFGKSYDRQKVIEQNKKNAVRHAYFREYLALQRLAYMFRFDARNGDLKEALMQRERQMLRSIRKRISTASYSQRYALSKGTRPRSRQ